MRAFFCGDYFSSQRSLSIESDVLIIKFGDEVLELSQKRRLRFLGGDKRIHQHESDESEIFRVYSGVPPRRKVPNQKIIVLNVQSGGGDSKFTPVSQEFIELLTSVI